MAAGRWVACIWTVKSIAWCVEQRSPFIYIFTILMYAQVFVIRWRHFAIDLFFLTIYSRFFFHNFFRRLLMFFLNLLISCSMKFWFSFFFQVLHKIQNIKNIQNMYNKNRMYKWHKIIDCVPLSDQTEMWCSNENRFDCDFLFSGTFSHQLCIYAELRLFKLRTQQQNTPNNNTE